MLLHWRRCSPSNSHIRLIVVCHILWHIWKARNAHHFHGTPVLAAWVIHNILTDIHLIGLAVGFKASQLRGDFSVQFGCALRVSPVVLRLLN